MRRSPRWSARGSTRAGDRPAPRARDARSSARARARGPSRRAARPSRCSMSPRARTARRRVTDLAARSDPGLVRERNEDRWLTRDYRGVMLLAVADGVGGEAGGDVASTAAIETLAKTFAPPSFRESARSALGTAVQHANRAVLEAAGAEHLSRAAATLVAAAVRGREAAVANLGDSRAYLVRGDQIRQLTTDHSGELSSSITRFLGDPRGVQPDIFVETLQPDDRLVLCSDGLTRHVHDAEIAAAKRADPARPAGALLPLAPAPGGEGNVTGIVYAARRPAGPRALAGA